MDSLDFKFQDEQSIIERITPLFDKILLERIENKDAKTQEILSRYLADIISKTSKHDAASLSRSLQSVISPAIAKEIADNKDVMIDALYPIMGGMISKYVTQAIKEMMETINTKIEDGLSLDRIKRKVKAKVKGVSETELLLEESGDAQILSMFVIHKETSLLIAEAYLEDQKINDAHMVASMASAIKDFINDWMQNNDTNNEVQLLSYGNATLYIESAGSVFIVAFLDSEPDHTLRKKINTFFGTLLKEYAHFFQEYQGDDSAQEVAMLSSQMSAFLNAQEHVPQKKKSNAAKITLIVLGLFLLGYAGYLLSGWYERYSLESKIYEKTANKIAVTQEDSALVLNGYVEKMDDISKILDIVKADSDKPVKDHLLVPMHYLDIRYLSRDNNERNVSQLQKRLSQLEHNISSLAKENLRLIQDLKANNAYLKSLVKNKSHHIMLLQKNNNAYKEIVQLKKKIAAHLDSALKNNVYYDNKEQALDFRNLGLFEPGSVVHKKEAILSFVKTVETYMGVLADYTAYLDGIIIEGHSDSSGSEKDNLALSKQRAMSIKHLVENMETVKQHHMQSLIGAEAYGSSQTVVREDGSEDKEKSRRIKIRFTLSDEKILNKLGSMLND